MRVLGIGDHVMDHDVLNDRYYPGGNALNFTVYAHMIAVDSAYLGCFGDDEFSCFLKNMLKDMNIDISKCEQQKNSVCEICDIEVRKHDRLFIKEDQRENLSSFHIKPSHLSYINQFDLIHMSCYGELEDDICLLDSINACISYDFSSEEAYRSSSYLNKVLPYIDIAQFSLADFSIEECCEFARDIFHKGVSYVVITRGDQGSIVYDGSLHTCEIVPCDIKDTTGAGDAFISAFEVSLLLRDIKESNRIEKAMRDASIFASKICEMTFSFDHVYQD